MKPIYSILIFLIILAASCSRPSKHFDLQVEDAVKAMLFSEEVTVPEEIMEAVQKNSGSVVLVDVRTPAEFAEGHLLNAINIPSQHVLEAASCKLWRDEETTYYLYGNTQLEANGPWMVLRQLGYENIKVLQGGLSYFADFSDSSFLKLEDETARYDFASVFSKAIEDAKKANAPAPAPVIKTQPKTIVPQKRPKIEQPKTAVEQEEEGC